jgi:hypothetical protein
LRRFADTSTGYLHANYASSLSEFGRPVQLDRSGSWIIERAIPSSASIDAMGCYPLFCCAAWASLKDDFSEIERGVVSLTAVADPFGDWTPEMLSELFPDLCRPYKMHNVIDLRGVEPKPLAANHLRNIRRAQDRLQIEVLAEPSRHLLDWQELYANLIARHGISGISAFSKSSFEWQFCTPGLQAIGARRGDEWVGMTLWYEQGERAYYHLGAYSEEGYELSASFGIFSAAIEFFRKRRIRYLNLGAGLDPKGEDGLSRFKRGWANAQRPVYICGRIFDREAYVALKPPRNVDHATAFFPAYRG